MAANNEGLATDKNKILPTIIETINKVSTRRKAVAAAIQTHVPEKEEIPASCGLLAEAHKNRQVSAFVGITAV